MATQQQPVPPFLAQVLGTLLASENVSKPAELVRENWSVIREAFESGEGDPQTLDTFLTTLPILADLFSQVVDDTFDVCDSGLYVALLRCGADANFVSWCAHGLSSVSREEWSGEIQSQGDLVDLVTELRTREASMALGTNYFDALVEYAEGIAKGPEGLLAEGAWPDLFALLDTHHRKLFPRRAYKILRESDGRASADFFDLFGDMLSDRELLANEQRFVDQVCRPILDEDNVRGIEWIAEIVIRNPDLLTRHDDRAALDDFKDRLSQRLDASGEDDPALLSLKRIGSAIGI